VRHIGKVSPSYGDRKTVTKFALFPIKIENEMRWLEYVTMVLEFRISEWTPICFIKNQANDISFDYEPIGG
jgi:hypothetical protein